MLDSNRKQFTEDAAFLLSKVVLGLWPDAQLYSIDDASPFFSCQFFHRESLDQNALIGLENSFYALLSNQPDVERVEMLTSNAIELFKHQKQKKIIETLGHPQSLVTLARFEGHYFPCSFSSSNPFEGKAQILDLQVQDASSDGFFIQVMGSWGKDSRELKEQRKAYKEIQKKDGLRIGHDLGLWDFNGLEGFTLPKGEKLFELSKQKINRLFKSEGWQEISEFALDKGLKKYFDRFESTQRTFAWTKVDRSSQDLFYQKRLFSSFLYQLRLVSTFLKEKTEQECNYCLKFILKLFKILGFSYRCSIYGDPERSPWVQTCKKLGIDPELIQAAKENKLSIELVDSWGRSLAFFDLELSHLKHTTQIKGHLSVTLDRFLVWMLEAQLLSSELISALYEVRVVALSQVKEYAEKVFNELSPHVHPLILDVSKEPLKTKVHRALKEKVPYLLILGPEEQKTNTVKVNLLGETESQQKTLEAFLDELKSREKD